jgi:hypothetical protein
MCGIYIMCLWTSYKEPTFEHARPCTGQTSSSDYLYPRSIAHVLFNATSGEFLWAYPVLCSLELDLKA